MKKNCKHCGKEFTPDKFHPNQEYCSNPLCKKERNRLKAERWRNKNPKRAREVARNWKIRNPERAKEVMRQFDKSEKRKAIRKRRYPKRKAYNKLWLKENPEKSAEYSKAYNERYPEKRKKQFKNYRNSPKGKELNRKWSKISRAKRKGMKYIKIMDNPFPCGTHGHHINDFFVFPIPSILHTPNNNSNQEKHRNDCNNIIQQFFGFDLKPFLEAR